MDFTATAGHAVVLVSAHAPTSTTSPNGLFDVNIQSTGASARLLFDKTQSVTSATAAPALFNAQPITVTDNSSYDVTLTDLKFPVAFGSLTAVVSRGTDVLGKIFGGGSFSFIGTSGTYQLTFVASPASAASGTTLPVIDEDFGLYATSVVYSPPVVTPPRPPAPALP